LIIPARGYSRPHFGPEEDRIYLYLSNANGRNSGLISIRYDGSDRRSHLVAKGPGDYATEERVSAQAVRISPDGRHALIHHANQLYVAFLLNTYLQNVTLDLVTPELPLARLTDVGADFFSWSQSGETIFWSVGHQIYTRPLASIAFVDGATLAGEGAADSATAELAEVHEAVTSQAIEVYLPRYQPEGTVALLGATIIPMATADDRIEDGVVLIENDRIAAVGTRDAVIVPPGTHEIDVSGRFIVPGYIDTHAHYRPLRRVLDTQNWAFLANLAYGVTTGLDVEPGTTDILAYQDLIDAGLMLGPRALSTGPGVSKNNAFRSAAHTKAVLSRYKDHYLVNNLKNYLAGNRQQRQWIVAAARELKLMPTTEGGLDMKLDMTHLIDGFSGNEHNFPVLDLFEDIVQLVARSQMSYTPALLVNYGGPHAENYFYTRENPHRDPKLRRFMPASAIASRTLRTQWALDEEYVFPQLAAQAAKIIRAGGRVGVGAHGQLQGLGYHWELSALASGGLTPREVLRAATRHGAEIIGVAQDIGTVSVGKLADLVVLSQDPTVDIRNAREIVFVVKNGEIFEGDTLDKVWPEVQPLPTQWWWHSAPGGL
jgi:imidazolonepropionase-like amidohydrolase